MREQDLYEPLKKFFENEGYEIRSEVKDCDIVCLKDEEMIIIEMKTGLTIKLLTQAVLRQKITENVYVAVPKKKMRLKEYNEIIYLLKRLELGLIRVDLKTGECEVKLNPDSHRFKMNKKKRSNIKKEFLGRSADYNIGGSNKRKIITSYKERAIKIGCILMNREKASIKEIKELGKEEKTNLILQRNYYGWFERVERGIYKISSKGKKEIKTFEELYEKYNGI